MWACVHAYMCVIGLSNVRTWMHVHGLRVHACAWWSLCVSFVYTVCTLAMINAMEAACISVKLFTLVSFQEMIKQRELKQRECSELKNNLDGLEVDIGLRMLYIIIGMILV